MFRSFPWLTRQLSNQLVLHNLSGSYWVILDISRNEQPDVLDKNITLELCGQISFELGARDGRTIEIHVALKALDNPLAVGLAGWSIM